MKNIFLITAAILMATPCLADGSQDNKCTVTFDLNYEGAPSFQEKEVTTGRFIALSDKPLPTREGYRFAGWYTDKACQPEQEWIFGAKNGGYYPPVRLDSMAVNQSMKLYARWAAPTHISTPEQLHAMRNDLHGWYVLDNDIDLSGYSDWTPVGEYDHSYEMADGEWWVKAFKGKLDGQGHHIKNLHLTTSEPYMKGLFGAVANGEICRLTLSDCIIDIDDAPLYAAPLAAIIKQDEGAVMLVQDCVVENLKMKVTMNLTESGYAAATGLIAGAWNAVIDRCKVNGSMEINIAGKGQGGDLYIGGILGEAYCDTRNCTSTLDIKANILADAEESVFIGGLQASATQVTGSQSSGNISVSGNPRIKELYVGGLVGSERYGTIEDCKSSGLISIKNSPIAQVGGVIGEFSQKFGSIGAMTGVEKTVLRNCHSSNEVSKENVDNFTWQGVSGSGTPEPIKGFFGPGMGYEVVGCSHGAE